MADDSGFLGRWSRRKLTAKEGKPLAPEPPVLPPTAAPVTSMPVTSATPAAPTVAAPAPAETAAPVAPTLEDAQALTPQSDFKPFMTQGVAPEVKNAAMKKLFADPQFNVMDGLDIYIDDYSKPDPIPASMLRQMASAKFLKMFDEEEDEEAGKKAAGAPGSPGKAGLGDDADAPAAGTVAQSNLCKPLQSQPASPAPHASQPPDADPDLRLQPDDAPAGQEPGHRTG